jgi:hypothetical protein
MITARAKSRGIEAAAGFASNPAAQWLFVIILAGLVLVYVIPWILKGTLGNLGSAFTAAKTAFSNAVDSASKTITSITGKPSSQLPITRGAYDSVTGLLAAPQGDRQLSDVVDNTTTFFSDPSVASATGTVSGETGTIFSGTELDYMNLLKSLGYMDAAGNITPAGQAAIQNGTVPHMPAS